MISTMVFYFKKFRSTGKGWFFMWMMLMNFGVSMLTSLLGSLYEPDSFSTGLFDDWSLSSIFFITVVGGPFLETLIYQYAIIEGTLYYTGFNRKGGLVAMMLSTVLFGVSHWYNLVYMIAAIFMGLSLSFTYLLVKLRKDESPFIIVCLIHAMVNLMAFMINDFL